MNEKGYTLRPLLIRDHHAMVDLGILARPYVAARAKLQAWLQAEPKNHCFAVELNGAFLGAVCCFIEPRANFSARVELYLHEAAQTSVAFWIDDLITRCFDLGIHRLELLVPVSNARVIQALEGLGFEQDGLLRDALPLEAAWQDAALYSILREEHGEARYIFLPIATSVLVILGDAEAVHEIEFIQYGEKLEAGRRFDAAYAAGIIDAFGHVLSRNQPLPFPAASSARLHPEGQKPSDSAPTNADLPAASDADLPAATNTDLPVTANGEFLVAVSAELPVSVYTEFPAALRIALEQIVAYFNGERQSFDFPIRSHGTAFQEAIWSILREIPYAATRSYMEVALRYIGQTQPGLSEKERRKQAQNISRAVGMACGANPHCLITPCHRVLGQNLKLTGFSGGIETKAYLLDLELMHAVATE